MKLLVLFAAAALAAPAIASDNNGAPASGKPVDPPKKERKICRQEQVTSSLYGSHRTCLTAEQWKERDRSLQDLDPRAAGNAH
jgi:hypothetical protein